jgi:hypothetical protein
MVDDVPHSGVPANSVHTGGRSVESDGADESVGNAGSDPSNVESPSPPNKPDEAGAVVGVVVAVLDDAPALTAPNPITPSDSEAPNNEAATKRLRLRIMLSPCLL